jgi:hypothetical protein
MKPILLIILMLMLSPLAVLAQHEHHMPPPAQKKATAPVTKKKVAAPPRKKAAKKPAAPKPAAAPKAKVAAPAQKAPAAATPDHQHGHEGHNHEPDAGTMAPAQNKGGDDQHLHHTQPSTPGEHAGHEMAGHADTTMDHAGMHGGEGSMSHFLSLNLPMSRNGSGTGWNPDESPMYMYMRHSGKWMFMLHGNVFLRYNNQDVTNKGYRGDARWDAPSMVMAMGQRRVGKRGLFHASVMLSADALVTGQRGYPLLFQSGESAFGEPLVDRQHPHDLFSELSVSYAHSFSGKVDAYAYVGYPGEPALGATAFMHRSSGMDNPDAPLSHHWVDATHITFGVATLGVRVGKFKLEGSSFTGREPDENRYDFDRPRFDSRSARLWFAPSSNWALQVSHGFIKSPEILHAAEDVYRTTASTSYSKRLAGETFFNATGLWGMNKVKNHHGEHAALLEASFRRNKNVVYGRYEWVQKSTEELNLDEDLYGHDGLFPVHALTLGTGYDVLRLGAFRAMLGAQGSVYKADKALEPLYGRYPLAAQVYLRLYPGLMRM